MMKGLAESTYGGPISSEPESLMFDLDAFAETPLQRDPYDFIVVPGFLKADALDAVNADYPEIEAAGNPALQDLTYGPAFGAMIEELNAPRIRRLFAEKFGVDLEAYPAIMTVRKYIKPSQGNIHTDAKGKIITALIYFNAEWNEEGGRFRVLRSATDMEDYAVEVPPLGGTLVAFRRSDTSYHGYKDCRAERRSLQLNWVVPKKHAARDEGKKRGLKWRVKRLSKIGRGRRPPSP